MIRVPAAAATIDAGAHVLLKRYGRFCGPRTGDVACIRRGDGPMLIKRLAARDRDGRFGLSGDGPASAPAIDLGCASEREIVGRVVLRLSCKTICLIHSR
ncbi:MAG: hypothetical protein EPO10_25790 [Reyranella sp.]|uniref:S24/S26 family peptidase n=1 Tax=Reyranella sp. TaxID=1929291 RepID=UPI00121E44AB|nr:S24/S26 family peptidase [Reyranella sp.]TAJ84856.1 MAG: hypothetical protein EPO41_28655 [Reyranella sp.]TBR24241.1 MAG: hypothetical protein EPO10_25790 [Reyranella sp.]